MLKQRGRRIFHEETVSKNSAPKNIAVTDVEMKEEDEEEENQQTNKKMKVFQCMFCPAIFGYKIGVYKHCKTVRIYIIYLLLKKLHSALKVGTKVQF